MRKYPVELHTHTQHSDGQFKVSELCQEAKSLGYKAIAITDHNTYAGYEEVKSLGCGDDLDLVILEGIEWTTFYGHFLVHGPAPKLDWTSVDLENIEEVLQELNQEDTVVTIAHPFDVGSPICTGCAWEYDISDFNLVDQIEVWNSDKPHLSTSNYRAYNYWLDKLNAGYRVGVTCGRDWHGHSDDNDQVGINYLLIKDDLTQENLLEAMKRGQSFITLGPLVDWTVEADQTYLTGQEIPSKSLENFKLSIQVSPPELAHLEADNYQDLIIKVFNNDQCIFEDNQKGAVKEVTYEVSQVDIQPGYLRVEVRGHFKGDPAIISLTNPIYIN